ncbi:MAG: DNA/RNA nuclease SfsA [Syntrophomonadaceae bacterium]|nr:DNA/RNA nuclease SfsA [Syntrophomonadaceae bacterium]
MVGGFKGVPGEPKAFSLISIKLRGKIVLEIASEIVEGTFIKEKKSRFIGLIRVKGEVEECYVPNSSRMERYLNLKNKQVLLTVNKNTMGRTRYSLFAVKHYNSYILLNLNLVNAVLEIVINNNYLLSSKGYQISRERNVEGYKADLLLESGEEKIIIEAKGIISTKSSVLFPTVYSDRFTKQLCKIKQFLHKGWQVHYFFVSLSPFVSQITLDSSKGEYYSLIKDCIKLGMKTHAFSVSYKAKRIEVNKAVAIK